MKWAFKEGVRSAVAWLDAIFLIKDVNDAHTTSNKKIKNK